jgi:predicted nucleic acid-binding protein
VVVVDASTLLEMLLNRPRAEDVRDRLRDANVNAPHLVDVEVLHVLRCYALSGDIDEVRAHKAMLDHAELPIERHPHDPLLRLVWKLRENFTAYEATYVALAVVLRAPLITSDVRLARAASAFLPVEVFA